MQVTWLMLIFLSSLFARSFLSLCSFASSPCALRFGEIESREKCRRKRWISYSTDFSVVVLNAETLMLSKQQKCIRMTSLRDFSFSAQSRTARTGKRIYVCALTWVNCRIITHCLPMLVHFFCLSLFSLRLLLLRTRRFRSQRARRAGARGRWGKGSRFMQSVIRQSGSGKHLFVFYSDSDDVLHDEVHNPHATQPRLQTYILNAKVNSRLSLSLICIWILINHSDLANSAERGRREWKRKEMRSNIIRYPCIEMSEWTEIASEWTVDNFRY